MQKKLWVIPLFILAMALVTACGGSSADTESDHQDEGEHMDEQMGNQAMDHQHVQAPDEFASLTNPFADDEEAIEAGKVIYETNCTTCHGPEGAGDGEGGQALDPKPANLADSTMMPTLSDGYLFWRVSKGGALEPFNSAMPAWEQSLTEDQRWQVISYVRELSHGEHDHD